MTKGATLVLGAANNQINGALQTSGQVNVNAATSASGWVTVTAGGQLAVASGTALTLSSATIAKAQANADTTYQVAVSDTSSIAAGATSTVSGASFWLSGAAQVTVPATATLAFVRSTLSLSLLFTA